MLVSVTVPVPDMSARKAILKGTHYRVVRDSPHVAVVWAKEDKIEMEVQWQPNVVL
jgi:hypothetical protein